jgi:iron(III) transport system ATP-binding protein
VFEQPATEYVAAFIGMPNRLQFQRGDGGWTCGGITIDAPVPSAPSDLAVRLRADDVELAPRGTGPIDGRVSLPGTVVDAEYGGRHMDVIVEAGGTRLAARVPTGAIDSWARRLTPGDLVVATFHVQAGKWFDTDGRAFGGARTAGVGAR